MLRYMLAVSALIALPGQAQSESAMPTKRDAESKRFELNGVQADALIAKQKGDGKATGVQHVRYTYYDWWQCEADWNQVCDGVEVIAAPAGYQVCNIYYTITVSNGHDKWFHSAPTSFYPNDPQSPDRFRAGDFRIHAQGNNNPFDRRGSKIRVENVGLDLISADADNFTRYKEGCMMPSHG